MLHALAIGLEIIGGVVVLGLAAFLFVIATSSPDENFFR